MYPPNWGLWSLQTGGSLLNKFSILTVEEWEMKELSEYKERKE